MVTEAAEDEGLEYISADYILNYLSPFDFEEVERAVLQNTEDLADRGITAVLNLWRAGLPQYTLSRLSDYDDWRKHAV